MQQQQHALYKNGQLDERDMHLDPLCEFAAQWALAEAAYGEDASIMNLATVCEKMHPHSRMVLLKKQEGRHFYFFTQYRSKKAEELDFSPFGALLFFWPALGKQIRIEGPISKLAPADSAAYFKSRPRDAQIGAWASHQSQPLENREELNAQVHAFETRFASSPVPYPPHWGGYYLTATDIEFWQGRPARLHDRIAYTYQTTGWQRMRLSP